MIEIIAEIGQNHDGDMGLAKRLILKAKEAGADVAKFQLFEARKLFTDSPDYPWFDYNCKTEITRDQLHVLKNECDRVGIEFMASAFDCERVSWLEEIGVKRYKVASRSVNDTALLDRIYATGKPVIVSLGMWDNQIFPPTPDDSRTQFLYCVSRYPTELEDLHFSQIDLGCYAGFSDHTIGVSASMVAMARGAKIIEKHITLYKGRYGPDHACSATPREFSQLNQFRIDLEKMS